MTEERKVVLITGASQGLGQGVLRPGVLRHGKFADDRARHFAGPPDRENSDGVVVFEFDRPASVFGQFENDQVDVVAQRLDQDLQSALEAAAS